MNENETLENCKDMDRDQWEEIGHLNGWFDDT